MNSTDVINYKLTGFDSAKYFQIQKEKILERIEHFKEGRLYLEIGGKFLYDPHASRVLPGFDPDLKKRIFSELAPIVEIIFCIDAESIKNNRQLKNTNETYHHATLGMLKNLEAQLKVKPQVAINLCDRESNKQVDAFIADLKSRGYNTYKRYKIQGYPQDTKMVLSPLGYGADDYIPVTKKLILVTGAASNSGKMSTCLGQMYLEQRKGIKSGYAKYETFPIWNIPLEHPVNLAYEAATADIGDYNQVDTYYEKAYGKISINYNRDVQAFEILLKLGNEIVDKDNFIRMYRSPTDMGINFAGFAITNDEVISVASLHEIRRRRQWYQEILKRGAGSTSWIDKCNTLEAKALNYITQKEYNPNLVLD